MTTVVTVLVTYEVPTEDQEEAESIVASMLDYAEGSAVVVDYIFSEEL